MKRTLLIEPHDPVIFRDGKPFSQGAAHAKSLPFPVPATTVGAIRTESRDDWDFSNPDHIQRLLKIRQVGPFFTVQDDGGRWDLTFPAPADVVFTDNPVEDGNGPLTAHPLRPGRLGTGGCDLPEHILPLLGAPGKKPASRLPAFWKASHMMGWLSGTAPSDIARDELGFEPLRNQARMHVAIDPDLQTASEGMLFTTVGLEFRYGKRAAGIVSFIESDEDLRWPSVAPIGGERRLAYWSESADVTEPRRPEVPAKKGDLIRVILATPGAFDAGWRPAWAVPGQVVSPPGHPELKIQLIAAAVPRFQPISGWDLQKRGPKATRFLAPAGSVYFFEIVEGDPKPLWFQSIADREQDRYDGFGIALIGAAQWHNA